MNRTRSTRHHKRKATALYKALIDQLQDRIAFLGWPMWVCDEKSGLQDGYTAKLLHPDTASGRQATWQTLQLLIDALYPAGDFQLVIVPKSPRRPAKRGRQLRLWPAEPPRMSKRARAVLGKAIDGLLTTDGRGRARSVLSRKGIDPKIAQQLVERGFIIESDGWWSATEAGIVAYRAKGDVRPREERH